MPDVLDAAPSDPATAREPATATATATAADRAPLRGLGASPGCAVGPVRQVRTDVDLPDDDPVPDDPQPVATRIESILTSVGDELQARAARVEGETRAVLEATAMIARDSTLLASVRRHLGQFGPAHTIDRAVREVIDSLSAAGDYWAERSTDLLDIRDRAVARWCGLVEPGVPELDHAVVLVARDLAAADAALLDPEVVLGLVLEAGGPTAHTAIVAAQLGIPCVVHVAGATDLPDGVIVSIDGGSGEVIVDPSAEERTRVDRRNEARTLLRSTSSGPGTLRDGTRVTLCANVGTLAAS